MQRDAAAMETLSADIHQPAPAIQGLKYEQYTDATAAAVETSPAVQPSPGTGRTITTDTQQQPSLSRDGASTPSVSGMSGSQGTKVKGRSGPKSKCSPFIGVSQYKRTGRWEVSTSQQNVAGQSQLRHSAAAGQYEAVS
jgi:hypothetical protein